jgi:hypothetical protein
VSVIDPGVSWIVHCTTATNFSAFVSPRVLFCIARCLLFVVCSQQENLRWGCDFDLADRISNYNRHYAEFSGYWESTTFLSDVQQNIDDETGQVAFYDSGWKGSPLFIAPQGRSWEDFIEESTKHGWPSFRDSEVDWDYARVLPGGEMVSVDGTHLGHNLPDSQGNRYCISKCRNIDWLVVAEMSTDDLVRLCFVLILLVCFILFVLHLDLVSIAGQPPSDDSNRFLGGTELR